MKFQDFRAYLDYLEKKGKLVRVKKEVDTRFDIAAGIRKTSDIDGPALLFENIKGHPGWRVAGGVYATQKLIALAIGLPMKASEEQIVQRYLQFDQKRVKPKLVSTGPVKEIIIKGNDVDLTKLPIPIYSEKDGGPFLTSGVEIAKHPETGEGNVSIHRRMLLGKDRTALLAQPMQHLGAMIVEAAKKGQPLPVATVMGVDPSLTIASQVKAPAGVDETEIAGAIRGAPLELVRCETIDLEVPANAEVVIEGVVLSGETAMDGPFGEFPGNYVSMTGCIGMESAVVKVTAITMRKDPIFHAMLTGMPMTENHWLKKWSLAASLRRAASEIADVKAVNVTAGGTAAYHVIVSIRKKMEIEPRNVFLNLLSARARPRLVIVVDDDIDVYNPVDVEWAVATRVRPDKDIIILPIQVPAHLEPSPRLIAPAPSVGAMWGIDATMSIKDREWYQKICVPGVAKVDYI